MKSEKVILDIGHYIQSDYWDCGPSSLKIFLDYYKDKNKVSYLIKILRANGNGTLHSGFRNALKKLGYSSIEKENAEIKDIENFIRKEMPVIVDYQDYGCDHFSVVFGYDKKNILLSDPGLIKKYKKIPKKDFFERWYSEDYIGKMIYGWFITGYKN